MDVTLSKQLEAEGRPGVLAAEGEILLKVDNEIVLIQPAK
jgi:hypothetical protein